MIDILEIAREDGLQHGMEKGKRHVVIIARYYFWSVRN